MTCGDSQLLVKRYSKRQFNFLKFLFYFLFIGVLLWKGGEMAYESVTMLERTQTPWEPYVFHVILALPIAAFLLLLQGIADLIRNLKTLVSGKNS